MKTLIFDLDGTLIDTRHDLANAANHALKSIGQQTQSLKTILTHVGNGLGHMIKQVVGEVDEGTLKIAKKAFEDFYNEHCLDRSVPYKDVLSVVKELHRERRIGVVTNKPQKFAEVILSSLGFDPYVEVIYGGDALPQHKPDPTPVLKAMEQLGGKKESTMIIGDGMQDLQAGKNAGIKTCVVEYGFGFRPEMKDLKPDFVIKSFAELRQILS